MKNPRAFEIIALCAVALAGIASPVVAQERQPLPPDPRDPFPRDWTPGELRRGLWLVGIHAGVAVPATDLGDVASSGPSVGVTAGRWLTEAIAIRFRSDLDWPGGETVGGAGPNAGLEIPGWFFWGVDIGVTVDLTGGSGPFLFGLDLGVGGTRIDSGELGTRGVDQWFLAAAPGVVLGHSLGSRAIALVDARYRALFGNNDDLDPFLPEAASSLSHFQAQAGIQLLVGRP